MVVLHYTGMQNCEDARDRLCDASAEVSAHYLISETGELTQMVDETMRAWHAGVGQWNDITDVNSHSLGIELANTGAHPFPEPQMAALERLLADILPRHSIRPDGVIGHSDMAPGRKSDPGGRFDWERLERQGLARKRGRDPGPRDADPDLFRRVAHAVGYTGDVDDATLLASTRMRYRPWARGPLSADDFTPLGHTALWT